MQSLVSSEHHTVSSSEFGSGSPVLSAGTTPGTGHSSTLSVPSHQRTDGPKGKLVMTPVNIVTLPACEVVTTSSSTQTEPFFVGSLSSKTCLELLPLLSRDQLEHELIHRQSFGIMSDARLTRHTDKSVLFEFVENCLLKAIPSEYDNVLKNYQTLTTNISYLAKQTESEVEKREKLNELHQTEPPVTLTEPTVELCTEPDYSPTEVDFSELVCDLNNSINFCELTTKAILAQIPIERRGTYGRYTAYFGSRPYSYGYNTRHEPCEYPDNDIFNTILDKMKHIDSDFSYDDYTCLITHYPDGRATIPRHCDNEPTIVQDSTIYTISVGAERTLRLTNTTGRLQEHDVTMKHGTVYNMTRQSQDTWSHELVPDNTVTTSRISFTFRKLTDPTTKVPVPPIKPPEPVKPSIAMGSHHRILMLTDSILGPTPEHIFQRVENHKCIKKINYRLQDIFNFDPEFIYSDFVIIACGLNDLARHGLTAHTLADLVTTRLSNCCDRYPDTTFIFSSILHTKQDWLNDQIDELNKIMFELSVTTPNMRFFDGHQALVNDPLSVRLSNVITAQDKHGQHLTFAARKLVTDQLIKGIEQLAIKTGGVNNNKQPSSNVKAWSWPLRERFVRIFRRIASSYTRGNVR